MDIKEKMKSIALRNSILHGGKSNIGSIISNSMADPQLKENKDEVIRLAAEVAKDVNSLSLDEQKALAEEMDVDTQRHAKEQREGLPDLPNMKPNGESMELEGNVVLRMAPNPNAPLHLGSARPLVINGLYARKYNGKFILRFDDTDPDVKSPLKDAYDWVVEDCEWLGFKPDLIVYASDRFDIYIEKAYEMYKKKGAYICTCDTEEWREMIKKGVACPCRDNHDEERWHLFAHQMNEGEAVLRIKTSLSHKNPAVRDWPAMRIKQKVSHPRIDKSQRLWPMYNLQSAIDDHDFGVTHIIRGQEHMTNTEKQSYIFKFFGWDEPISIHHGKLIIEGLELGSKSKIRKAIDEGSLEGWDDPRSGTLRALRKQGIKPETIVKIMEKVGIRKTQAKIDMKNVIGENRK